MLKNRFFTAFAFVGLISVAACAAEEEDVQFDDPTLEEPTPAPITPAPMTEDTMTMPMDTAGVGADTTMNDSVTL